MAVINNVTPAEAIRHNMVEENETDEHHDTYDDGESLFIPEKRTTPERGPAPAMTAFGGFNPQASAFAPSSSFGTSSGSTTTSIFGQSTTQLPSANVTPAFTKKFSETLQPQQQDASTTPQPFTTKFGERLGSNSPQVGSAGLNASEGTSTPSTGFTFGTPAQTVPGEKSTDFGGFGIKLSADTPGPGPSTQTTTPSDPATSKPDWMKQFGTSGTNASAVNSPFGIEPSAAAPPKGAVAPASDAKLNVSFSSQPTFTFTSPFAPAPQVTASNTAPQIPTTITASTQKTPLFGFPKADSTPSVTTTQPLQTTQSSLPSFSFTNQSTIRTVEGIPTPPKPAAELFSKPEPSDSTAPDNRQSPAKAFAFPQTTQTSSTIFFNPPKSQATTPPFTFPAAPTPSISPPTTSTTPKAALPSFNLQRKAPAEIDKPAEVAPSRSDPLQKFTAKETQSAPPKPDHAFTPENLGASTPKSKVNPTQVDTQGKASPELLDHVAHLSLTQQEYGLVQHYLEYALPELLKPVYKQHQTEVRQKTLGEFIHSLVRRPLTLQIGSSSPISHASTERFGDQLRGGTT
jgi:hypothetical protein